MSTLLYILIAILLFGFLIAVHEFGHFIVAKAVGVKVNEFAIGMGPKLLQRKRGETEYTLRAFPIGGFCAMEGEGEDSEDPRSFSSKPAWKRFLVLVAGAGMNFIIGVLIFAILFAGVKSYVSTTLDSLMPGFPLEGENGLMPGDRIVSIDGHRIYLKTDLDIFLPRTGETMDLVVERAGKRITLDDLPLRPQHYDGYEQPMYGLQFALREATFADRLALTWYNSIDTVRLVWVSLGDLIRGAVGFREMSGVVGIVAMVGEAGEAGAAAAGFIGAVQNILSFFGLIAINLAVMNLLPIPALDGGQIFFLLVDAVWHLLSKKHIDQKYLGYINTVGLILLLGLMVVIAGSDILKLFGR